MDFAQCCAASVVAVSFGEIDRLRVRFPPPPPFLTRAQLLVFYRSCAFCFGTHRLLVAHYSKLFEFNSRIEILSSDHQRNFWLLEGNEIGRFIHGPTAVIDNFPVPNKEYLISLHFSPGFSWAVSNSSDIWRSSLVWPDMRVPSSVDFSAGNQEELPNVNDVVRQDVYIINNGEEKLRIWGMTLPESTFRFQAETGDTSNVILPGDSLQVGIVYLPKDHGHHASTLHVQDQQPGRDQRANPTDWGDSWQYLSPN
jgi:hypothetical protein